MKITKQKHKKRYSLNWLLTIIMLCLAFLSTSAMANPTDSWGKLWYTYIDTENGAVLLHVAIDLDATYTVNNATFSSMYGIATQDFSGSGCASTPGEAVIDLSDTTNVAAQEMKKVLLAAKMMKMPIWFQIDGCVQGAYANITQVADFQ